MIVTPSPQTYLHAKSLLEQGELVAFPTETVYGLGANALDTTAVTKIFTTKGRPQTNPIIVHVGDKSQISKYAEIQSPREQLIIDKLMPGPITILLQKKSTIPDMVTAGSDFVGIRIPANDVALELLRVVQLPLAAPSANISTKPSPTSAQMVEHYVGNQIPLIIDGGECEVGIESTVVKVEPNQIIITRPGYITAEDIQAVVGNQIPVVYAQKVSEITPGNRFPHYRPHAKVQIISHPNEIPLPCQGKGLGDGFGVIIATTEFITTHQQALANTYQNSTLLNRGTHKNLITCANKLFALYHQCDQLAIETIYIEALPEIGLGYAIMNRVKKSAQI